MKKQRFKKHMNRLLDRPYSTISKMYCVHFEGLRYVEFRSRFMEWLYNY